MTTRHRTYNEGEMDNFEDSLRYSGEGAEAFARSVGVGVRQLQFYVGEHRVCVFNKAFQSVDGSRYDSLRVWAITKGARHIGDIQVGYLDRETHTWHREDIRPHLAAIGMNVSF